MIFDAHNLSHDQILDADVCIMGAGAAGIAIACELIDSGAKVLLLESGGMGFDHQTQFLYKGEISGRKFTPLEFTRRRQFGGSTATWFGRCRPLDTSDFENQDWIPFSGWPISLSDLQHDYDRASRLFELADINFEEPQENYMNGNHANRLESKIFQFSPPTRFSEKYKKKLESAKTAHVFLHANVTHIELEKNGGAVSYIQCATLGKKMFRARAKIFVLAMGGLETTRVMLASRNIHPNGISNQHDLLGRFFMDHASFFDGAVKNIPENFGVSFFKLDYSLPMKNLGTVRAIGLTENYRKQHKLLNACAFFIKRPAYKMGDLFFSNKMQELIYISEMLNHTTPPSLDILASLGKAMSNSPAFIPILKTILGGGKRSTQLGLQIQLECVPNPESRITLSDQKDALGMNRIKLDWRLTSQDLESYRHFRTVLFDELEQMGFQTQRINHDLDREGWPVSIVPSKHHSGTTRMHLSPRQGVVDKNCRVHGVVNLFVASSSVFPTIGMANPTLTIVALALRAANAIKHDLQK